MEPNDVNSSSYSETDGSSSSIRTSEVNSTSTQAPQSSANHSGSSIQLSCRSCHVLHRAIKRRIINSAPESLRHVAISIPEENADSALAPQNDGSSSSIQPSGNSNSTSAPASNLNQNGNSTQPNWPSPHLLLESYSSKCVPLYKAALKGDWSEAKRIVGEDYKSMLRAAITEGYQTVLHVATGAKQTNFVKQMVQLTGADNLLTLQDRKGNTAFCFAAAVGSIEIAQFMLAKDPNLLKIRGGERMTPLYMAALFGQSKMASLLYRESENSLEEDDIKKIFFVSMQTGLYDFALQLLKENTSMLAVARHVEYGTALHMLARNPSAFTSSGPAGRLKSFISLGHDIDSSSEALELVRCLWKEIFSQLERADVLEFISKPSKLLFDAATFGNFKFLAELIGSYPDLVHQLDENRRSIFHIAIMHRHNDIFNLIYEIGFHKELIATYIDKQGNNLLHLAAQYSDPKPVSKVPGAALEMQQELLIFKEVEMIVKPSYKEMKNDVGKTPWEFFTYEHKMLLEEGETWMKSRAQSCSIVATLLTTIVFQAAFTVPGGNSDDNLDKGTPNFITKTWFQIFVMSDAIAFSCSLISTLIFLSILITSRYTESDFLKRLPFKLIGGMLTLFVSITTTMLSFSSSIFLAYRDKLNCFSLLTIILVFLPVALYALLQIRLLGDLLYSTYRLGFLLSCKFPFWETCSIQHTRISS